jgi:Domain of unknown function (DUF3291)
MHHLAQINVARLRYPQEDARLADFFANLDRVNAAAERMPGFVWRLADDGGNATLIQAFDDPRMLTNMSVWESVDAFETFVWRTVHLQIYRRRSDWFDGLDGPHFALWWVPEGHRPSAREGRERLEHLAAHGPSDRAFGWESLNQDNLWMRAQVA